MKKGDLVGFREQMKKHRKVLFNRSLFVIFEKMELVLFRNLVRRVHSLSKNSIVDCNDFTVAFNMNMKKVMYDIDETECIMGNLILKGYIKGYIHHEKRKVVFS